MIKSPLREWEGAASSLTGHVPSESEGRERAGASRGGGGDWDEGGAGVEGFNGLLIVLMPPSGSGRGQRAGRPISTRAKAKGRVRTGARGEGVGAERLIFLLF